MNVNLEKLLRDGLIEKVAPDGTLVRQTFALAERDVRASRRNLGLGDCDWAYAIAYNAVLQAGRSVMFNLGFRPRGPHGHIAVMAFLQECITEGLPEDAALLASRSRKRRHRIVYDEADTVSRGEAERALKLAAVVVAWAKQQLEKPGR